MINASDFVATHIRPGFTDNFSLTKIICHINFGNELAKITFSVPCIRHFSLLNVNFAGACGYDFVCDGR